MGRWRLGVLAAAVSVAGSAEATYSPPLVRVRIDADRLTHTVEAVVASDDRVDGPLATDARVIGAQYIGQLERASGLGLQLGVAVAHAALDYRLAGREAQADALFLGTQLRAYAMVWSAPGNGRDHALTAFANLRLVHYRALGNDVVESLTLGGGLGLMAEIALFPGLSVCPYAWLTPGLYHRYRARVAEIDRSDSFGPGFKTPLQVGLDAWIYPFGSASDDHLSLSVIASLVDTSGAGSRTISGVIGWTF